MKKKHWINPLLFAAFIFGGCSANNSLINKSLELINEESLRPHLLYLASDSLKGRPTPSDELDKAAKYVAHQFQESGLSPAGGSYLHRINFGKISLGEDNFLKITKGGSSRNFAIKTDFTPLEVTASREVSGEVVFAGYGITAPEYNYDDYKSVDVKGKIVFILRHEPGETDSLSVFDGIKLSEYSQVNYKVRNAIEHGAAGIMLATDPLNHSFLSAQGFPWPSLSKFIPKDALPVSLIEDENTKVPVIQAGKEVIIALFGSADSLKQLEKTIDESMQPQSFLIRETAAAIKTSTQIEIKPASLAAALYEGSDPELKNEVIILGAHYDHVGSQKQSAKDEDIIFNGADDNASGTSALISIAGAIGKSGIKTKRSILLLAFPGEEIGLLGSEYYTKHPIFALEKTAAMINIDMIGRNAPDSLYVVGATRCPELSEIVKEENGKGGFLLGYTKESFLSRSDQANFLKNNVPSLFLTSGEHSDYHKVTDEASRINFEKAAKITRLLFRTLVRLANDHAKYKVTSNKVSLF